MEFRYYRTQENLPSYLGSTVWHRCAAGLILAAACGIYLAHVYAYNFVSDDAFITLRYSRHLAEGHGLVFNLNERVEGFTSLSWTVLLSGMYMFGLDLLVSARLLGIVFGLAVIVLSYRLVLVSYKQRISPLIAGITPLVLASNGSLACWAASGMETTLYICLIVASFLAVFSGKLLRSSLLVMTLLLTRPEGTLVFALLGLFLLLQHRQYKRMHMAMWFIVCSTTLGALFTFRCLYYGEWLPNTYYAKTGGGVDQVSRGLHYLAQYAEDHEGLIILVALVVYWCFVGNIKQRFLALGAVVLWSVTVAAGGDGLPMYRFALAPLPLLAVLPTHIIADLYRVVKPTSAHRWKLNTITVAVVILLITVHATKPIVGYHFGLYDYQKRVEIPRWTMVGKWLRDNAREGDSVAAVPIGAISYYSGLTVLDMMGLTDKHIAHLVMPAMGQGWAGHEKHDGQYILRRRPTYLLLGNIDVTEQPRDPLQKPFIQYFSPAVWAREQDFYETDLLTTMYEPCSVQIAPGQFLNFYKLRDSFQASGHQSSE